MIFDDILPWKSLIIWFMFDTGIIRQVLIKRNWHSKEVQRKKSGLIFYLKESQEMSAAI